MMACTSDELTIKHPGSKFYDCFLNVFFLCTGWLLAGRNDEHARNIDRVEDAERAALTQGLVAVGPAFLVQDTLLSLWFSGEIETVF